MTLVDDLQTTLQKQAAPTNPGYQRTLLKESLQNKCLDFIYNHPQYKNLIFAGGTCLRKLYGLPRLSEDLDFDYLESFQIKNFVKTIKQYFAVQTDYSQLYTKITNNEQSVYLKFPILETVGLVKNNADPKVLFLRCDFAQEKYGVYETEVKSVDLQQKRIFIKGYDLTTLFANKIIAFLERVYFKGKKQKVAFKGRDLYDLTWLLERSIKNNYELQPHWSRAEKALEKSREEIIVSVMSRVKKIKPQLVVKDLRSFLASAQEVEQFAEYFKPLLTKKLPLLLKD